MCPKTKKKANNKNEHSKTYKHFKPFTRCMRKTFYTDEIRVKNKKQENPHQIL